VFTGEGKQLLDSGYYIIEENFDIEEPGAFRVEALCKPKDKCDDLALVTVWGWR
jgi:hypothetical protein